MPTTASLKAAWLLVALCCLGLSSAAAQYAPYTPFRYTAPVGYGGYNGYYGGGYGGGTAYGSMATGMGNLVRAQGEYNVMTAQAAQASEQAYSMALDNRVKAAQAKDELQRLNRQRAAEKKQRESEIWAKNVPPPKRPRLTISQLDPVTGEINWNPLLLADEFKSYREKLQALFTQRVKDPGAVSYYNVSPITGAMRDYLDTLIAQYPTNEFFAARHFIEAIAEESRYSGLDNDGQASTTLNPNAPPG
ncbi:MAG: hypothetical protein K8U03_02630 [Planctomycetia bacterium]|nr:hypothetical protein [Planctomycetia bacterium]